MTSGQELGVHSRYVQYRAVLSTSDTLTTPALRDLTIVCEPYSDAAAPAITAVARDAGSERHAGDGDLDHRRGGERARWTTGRRRTRWTANAGSALFFIAHSLHLTGLTPGTTYYYRVTSADPSNDAATSPVPAEAPLSFATPRAHHPAGDQCRRRHP